MFDPSTWPEVPVEDRPKRLYHNMALDEGQRNQLNAKGWLLVDTRVMPSNTDAQRLEAVKAVLEGIRQGSIETDKAIEKYLDMELYVLGIKGKVQKSNDEGDVPKQTLEDLLDFKGSPRLSQDFRDGLKKLDVEREATKPKKRTKKEGK